MPGAMTGFNDLFVITIKSNLRDKTFLAILFTALAILFLIPLFSTFSMRQVQELSITLSLSSTSIVLAILSIFIGSSSIWRDIERRFLAPVMGLPLSRSIYVISKFCGLATVIACSALVLGIVSLIVIGIASHQYPSEIAVHWTYILFALLCDMFKYILLAAFGMLFSTISTSFFLPIFGSIVVLLTGNATQEMFEFVSGDYGRQIPRIAVMMLKFLYYTIPNFEVFDFKVNAIYGIQITASSAAYSIGYFIIYTSILIVGSQKLFLRRPLV